MSKIKPNKIYFLLLSFTLLLVLPFSVSGVERSRTNEGQTSLTKSPQIAVILPLSGPFAEYGEALKKGYQLGFFEAAATTKITAPQYRVKYLDSKGNPETTRSLISLLKSEGEVLIATGTPLNATAWTASRACEKNNLPYLIVGADQNNLINNETAFTFRLTQKQADLDRILTNFMAGVKPEIKSMGIIYGDSSCAINRARHLRKLCVKRGIDLAIWEKWKEYGNNRDNFYDLLNIVKERRPEILLLVTDQVVANRLWQQGKRLGIMPQATISIPVDCITTALEPELGSNPADQLIYASPWSTPWLKLSGEEEISPLHNTLLAQGSAAARVIITGLRKSLNLTPAEIVKSMESTEINTVYGKVRFSKGASGHQNPAAWYLSRNNGNGEGEVIFPRFEN